MCKFADTNQLSNDLNISFQLRQFEVYKCLQNYRVKNKGNNINKNIIKSLLSTSTIYVDKLTVLGIIKKELY
jgi:hypothetical protein